MLMYLVGQFNMVSKPFDCQNDGPAEDDEASDNEVEEFA